jgi:hypothetical protein
MHHEWWVQYPIMKNVLQHEMERSFCNEREKSKKIVGEELMTQQV